MMNKSKIVNGFNSSKKSTDDDNVTSNEKGDLADQFFTYLLTGDYGNHHDEMESETNFDVLLDSFTTGNLSLTYSQKDPQILLHSQQSDNQVGPLLRYSTYKNFCKNELEERKKVSSSASSELLDSFLPCLETAKTNSNQKIDNLNDEVQVKTVESGCALNNSDNVSVPIEVSQPMTAEQFFNYLTNENSCEMNQKEGNKISRSASTEFLDGLLPCLETTETNSNQEIDDLTDGEHVKTVEPGCALNNLDNVSVPIEVSQPMTAEQFFNYLTNENSCEIDQREGNTASRSDSPEFLDSLLPYLKNTETILNRDLFRFNDAKHAKTAYSPCASNLPSNASVSIDLSKEKMTAEQSFKPLMNEISCEIVHKEGNPLSHSDSCEFSKNFGSTEPNLNLNIHNSNDAKHAKTAEFGCGLTHSGNIISSVISSQPQHKNNFREAFECFINGNCREMDQKRRNKVSRSDSCELLKSLFDSSFESIKTHLNQDIHNSNDTRQNNTAKSECDNFTLPLILSQQNIIEKTPFEVHISQTQSTHTEAPINGSPLNLLLTPVEESYPRNHSENLNEPKSAIRSKRKRTSEQLPEKLDNIISVLFEKQPTHIWNPLGDLTNATYSSTHVKRIKLKNIEKIANEKWLGSVIAQSTSNENIKAPSVLISTNYNNDQSGQSSQSYIKRYRRGKTNIYRLKTERTEQTSENLEINAIPGELRRTSSSSLSDSHSSDDSNSTDLLSSASNEPSEADVKLRLAFNAIFRDKSLIYHEGDDKIILENIRKDVIKSKIQDLFLQVFDAFEDGKSPCFAIRRASYDNCTMKDRMLTMKSIKEGALTTNTNYSHNSKRIKFCLILYLMGKIYILLEKRTKLTKREMFYQIKHIIKHQWKLNKAVEAISTLLDVGQWDLNIISHGGLVYGDLKLIFSNGQITNCNVAGTMIPYEVNDIIEIQTKCYFILVVEKESIFCKLIEEDLPNKLTRPFVMITGKGFPGLNTQLFLKKLWTILSVPVFILVDGDPHGIQIMITYRFGSLNSCHLSHYLAVPNARWLGVFPSEIMRLGMNYTDLNEREVKMVGNLMKSPYVINEPRIKEELHILLATKRKSAIEGLMRNDKYLGSAYLPTKFFTEDYV